MKTRERSKKKKLKKNLKPKLTRCRHINTIKLVATNLSTLAIIMELGQQRHFKIITKLALEVVQVVVTLITLINKCSKSLHSRLYQLEKYYPKGVASAPAATTISSMQNNATH